MPRQPRLDTRNGLYHVITKGNDNCDLFRESVDFLKFIHLLGDAKLKDPHILLSYCLMPSHIHLLIETTEVPLSRIMHRLLLRYSLYFNKKHQRTGHLYQNRFKAKPCKNENYLLQLLVYIHDNPRKAGLLNDDGIYPFSSERVYQRKVATSAPVDNMRALELIGPSPKAALRAYHSHLSYTRSEKNKPWEPIITQIESETPFFPDQIVYMDTKPITFQEHPLGNFDFLKNVPLDQICEWVADMMGVGETAIKGRGRGRDISKARGMLIYIAREAGWRSVDLKNEFGFNPGTIAYHSCRYTEGLNSKEMRRMPGKLRHLFEVKNQVTRSRI